jgi:hypothetical protein
VPAVPEIKAVSLWVVLTRDDKSVVPLNRRGPLNRHGKPQSFQGLLQPPVHGKTDGRSPSVALLAEIEEEGGPAFAAMIRGILTLVRQLSPVEGVQPYRADLTEAQWATYRRGSEFVDEEVLVDAADLTTFSVADPVGDKAYARVPRMMFRDHLDVLSLILLPQVP